MPHPRGRLVDDGVARFEDPVEEVRVFAAAGRHAGAERFVEQRRSRGSREDRGAERGVRGRAEIPGRNRAAQRRGTSAVRLRTAVKPLPSPPYASNRHCDSVSSSIGRTCPVTAITSGRANGATSRSSQSLRHGHVVVDRDDDVAGRRGEAGVARIRQTRPRLLDQAHAGELADDGRRRARRARTVVDRR